MVFANIFLVLLNSKTYEKYETMALQDQLQKEAAKKNISTSDPKPIGIYLAVY